MAKKVPLAESVEVENSFATFLKEETKPSNSKKCQSPAIYSGYVQWCKSKKLEPLSNSKCCKHLRDTGIPFETRRNYYWYSVEMWNYPSVVDCKTKSLWNTLFDNGFRGPETKYNARVART